MIIIGIDPGTRITGYGIIKIDGNRYCAVDYGCIRPPPTLKLTDRYLIIFESLEELIKRHAVSALVVETQYVQKNPQSAIKLGMARGVAILAAKRKNVAVFEYSPTKAKLAVVGNGRASKAQVQGMTQRLLNLQEPPTPEDAADALALAICHANSLQYLNIMQMEI